MADVEKIGTVSAQPKLTVQNERTGATTTDPTARARTADAGVRVDPESGRVSERGPSGPEMLTEVMRADRPMFVRVGAPTGGTGEKVNRKRLMGEDLDDEGDLVLYLPGDHIPAEHRDLPTVPAVHQFGVWVPKGSAPTRKR